MSVTSSVQLGWDASKPSLNLVRIVSSPSKIQRLRLILGPVMQAAGAGAAVAEEGGGRVLGLRHELAVDPCPDPAADDLQPEVIGPEVVPWRGDVGEDGRLTVHPHDLGTAAVAEQERVVAAHPVDARG